MLISTAAAARVVVPVFDVPGLYAAVNDPSHAGALLMLATGKYPLDPAQAHCGRLELQQDMGIQGVEGAAGAVIIDAARLYPAAPGPVCGEPRFADGSLMKSGAIRTGRGRNSVAWLTVTGAKRAASAITTDLGSRAAASVSIAHVVATQGSRGLDIRNIGPDLSQRMLTVDLEDNVLSGNTGSGGQGLRVANIGVKQSVIRISIKGTAATGNIAGCLFANLNSRQSSISVDSQDNVFDLNANGCVLLGGLSDGSVTPVDDATQNSITFGDQGSSFSENANGPLVQGGIVAVGGQVQNGTGVASQNSVKVQFSDSLFQANQAVDVNAIAALADAGQTVSQNSVVLQSTGATGNASICTEQANKNTVRFSGIFIALGRCPSLAQAG